MGERRQSSNGTMERRNAGDATGQHRATTYQIVMNFPDRTPMSTLTKSRPDIGVSRPDIGVAQTGHGCPTNLKEPLLEPHKTHYDHQHL
jgi:hypothetical protein